VRAEVGCFTSRPLFRQGITPPWAVRYLRSLILPEAQPAKPSRRILLLRKDEKKRPLANAAELEAALAPHGFVSVEPAKLSVTEQARLFAEAEAIIAVHGAALANLVFASAGTHVLEILPLGPRLGVYRILADRVGTLYDCVFGNGPLGDKDAALVVDPVTITSAVSQWSLTAK